MDFDQVSLAIVDFLAEAPGAFVDIDFLDVAGQPSLSASDMDPIASSAIREFLPKRKLPFIGSTGAHGWLANEDRFARESRVLPGRNPPDTGYNAENDPDLSPNLHAGADFFRGAIRN
jgi:hypothetical protein